MYNTKKRLRLVRQPGEVGKGSKEARPSPIRQARPHALLGALPSRACLSQLGHPGLGEADELLAPVVPGADGYPAGVDQGAEVTCQRRLVQRRQAAEVSLPDLTRTAKLTEQGVLGRAQADAAQLLVVEPAHGPRRLPQGVAKAGSVHRRKFFNVHLAPCMGRPIPPCDVYASNLPPLPRNVNMK